MRYPDRTQHISFYPAESFRIVAIASYILLLVLLLTTLEDIFIQDPYYRWKNTFVPLLLILVSWGTAFIIVVRTPECIWTPIPWFLGAAGLFYGIGPLVYIFGNEATIEATNLVWSVDQKMIWKVHRVVLVALSSVLFFFSLFSRFLPNLSISKQSIDEQASLTKAKTIVLLFLVVGGGIRYLVELPFQFGLISYTIPGVILRLSSFLHVALFLLGYISVKEKKILSWRWSFYIFVSIEVLASLLSLSKQAIAIAVIFPVLGRFFAHRKIRSILILVASLAIMYPTLKSIVARGRTVLQKNTGRSAGTLQERIDGMSVVLQTEDESNKSIQHGWRRLNYVDVMSFSMDQYDNGEPGQTYNAALYVLIPRLIWPDKPIISSAGGDFTELYTGHRGSSTGLTVYGEAYWNGGYIFVLFTSFYLAILFSVITHFSMRFIFFQDWMYLPALFITAQIGMSLSGWFSISYVGLAGFFFVYIIMLFFIKRILRNL